MKPTRQRLLEILENRPGATAADLSRSLQLTQADIRHHLSNMVQEGLIIPSGHLHSGRRGRPARRFSLAASEYKDNFDLLSKALLVTAFEGLSPDEGNAFLKRVADHLISRTPVSGPLSQRLVQAVRQLNELGYQARWEAHAEAPKIIFERCPFAALRPQHPELCQLDSQQLEIMSGESITQVESSANLENGSCLFFLGKINAPTSND
jgi:predicted ArsR family transcriptional regulator